MQEEVLEFIMLPTVDFCFQELMNNPKVRKGFVAAVMRMEPEQIQETFLMPTKTGELYSDKLEIQILELKKLPKEVQTGDALIAWMKFFSGKISIANIN